MKIILPVAGKGERMRPYTNNLPKCLLPVGGKTIIDWIVGDTRPLAPTETIFITGYKAEAMDRYLAGKPEWGKTRTVLQSDPQGLGQAISLALPYTSDDEPLLIILGDTLFDADLGRLAGESENVLYTYKVQDPRRFGVAVTGRRAFPGQGRGRALAARSRGVTPRLPRLEGRVHLTSGPPGPSGFHP